MVGFIMAKVSLHMACQVEALVHGGLILAPLEGASLGATAAQIPPVLSRTKPTEALTVDTYLSPRG
jgi:hypothetical protein